MNKVILTGRFTRDPEIKYANDGTSIARFSIAVNRRFVKEGSDQKADFLNCIAFGKSAEFIEKYFSKGMKANLSGRIQTGSYTNRDGQKVYTTDILALHSTMFLLIQSMFPDTPLGRILYIPQCFY